MGFDLRFCNVSYNYSGSEEKALKNINLEIKKGEFVGIIGPNAAGKSTLCRAASGLIPHSFTGELSGDIYVKEINIKEKKPAQLAQYVGHVFADPEAQLSQMTVWEEIAFGPANLGVPKDEILSRIETVLDLLNIKKMRDRSPFTLSGGEQQRVAIASVLAMQPNILILDEPTSNLDPRGTSEVFDAVKSLNREHNLTVVMVEHEVELLAQYATRIIFMNQGQIVLDGPPREIFRQAEVIQETGMNIPQVTEVAQILDKKFAAWDQRYYPLTIDEAYDSIMKKIKSDA